MRRLLQLALDALGNLLQRVLERRARPLDPHRHSLYGEGGILVTPELHVGRNADHDEHCHEIMDEGAMLDRPGREVEPTHNCSPRRRTFCPGRSACTPAVTTNS